MKEQHGQRRDRVADPLRAVVQAEPGGEDRKSGLRKVRADGTRIRANTSTVLSSLRRISPGWHRPQRRCWRICSQCATTSPCAFVPRSPACSTAWIWSSRAWRASEAWPVMLVSGRPAGDRATMLDLVRLTRTESGLRAVWLEAHREAEPVFVAARRTGHAGPDRGGARGDDQRCTAGGRGAPRVPVRAGRRRGGWRPRSARRC